MAPQVGDFVRVRNRRWLVEETSEVGGGLATITLAGIDDDALGEQAEIVWEAELDKEILNQDDWPSLLGSHARRACDLLGLPPHNHLEHRQRGRQTPPPSAISSGYSSRRLSASPASQSAAAASRQPTDRG